MAHATTPTRNHFDSNCGIEPRMLLAWRKVTHYADDPANHTMHSVTQAKAICSLEHQAAYSLRKLREHLEAEGLHYRLAMVRQDFPTPRWDVYANGANVAFFDDDWGYDRFNESATSFAEAMWAIIQEQGLEPLTDEEIEFLAMYEKAARIVEVECRR